MALLCVKLYGHFQPYISQTTDLVGELVQVRLDLYGREFELQLANTIHYQSTVSAFFHLFLGSATQPQGSRPEINRSRRANNCGVTLRICAWGCDYDYELVLEGDTWRRSTPYLGCSETTVVAQDKAFLVIARTQGESNCFIKY